MNIYKELYKIKEVAEIIGVSERTVKNWIYQGKISTIHFGKRCVRIPKAEVKRIIRKGL